MVEAVSYNESGQLTSRFDEIELDVDRFNRESLSRDANLEKALCNLTKQNRRKAWVGSHGRRR